MPIPVRIYASTCTPMSTSHLLALLVQSCQKRRCNRSANGGSCFFPPRTKTGGLRLARRGLGFPPGGVTLYLEGGKDKTRVSRNRTSSRKHMTPPHPPHVPS